MEIELTFNNNKEFCPIRNADEHSIIWLTTIARENDSSEKESQLEK